MGKHAIEIANKFLYKEGIYETKETLWKRWETWNARMKFNDVEIAAAAIISGDYDVENAYSLNDFKDFYFHGGLAS